MKHVLVVDDDADIRMAVRAILEDAGYAVTEAADGLVAMEALRHSGHRFVVLLDIDMPRFSGTDVLNAVKADQHLRSAHAYLLMTAKDKTFSMVLARLVAEMQLRILSKPFDIDHLLTLIKTAGKALPR